MKLNRWTALNGVSCLLLLAANQAWGCQQGNGTNNILLLPSLGGSVAQANALNPAGQITGFSYLAGDTAAHAFLYSGGSVTDLGTLGGNISQGFAINTNGLVAGQADTGAGETHAALYNGTNFVDLGTLGGSFSSAADHRRAINSAGTVVGDSLLAGDTANEAFVAVNGVMTGLGDLGGGFSSGLAINENGNIVGDSVNVGGEDHAFLYANGSMMDLGTLGGNDSLPHDINDSDVVVGESTTTSGDTHAFVWTSGPLTDLGTLGGLTSSALAINNADQIIGDSDTTGGESHGFIYSGGVMTDLGTLGGHYSSPQALNNLGQVVGDSADSNGDPRAFLWQDGTMIDLNNTLPLNSGWILTGAQIINDAGRIVGFGTLNGTFHYFIMDLAAANNPPVANAGADQTVECPTQVRLDGSQSTDPDNDPLTFEWSEGASVLGTSSVLMVDLPIGTHTLTLKVTDTCGATSQDTVVVQVSDTTAPVIVSGPAIGTLSANDQCQAAVPNVVPNIVASDNCTTAGSLSIVQSPTAGTLVGLGPQTILVTVTDASGNSTSGTLSFTVADTTAPTIQSVTASPNVLSPPNGKMIPVTVTVVASDSCDPAPVSKITSVTANETVNAGDIQITGDLTVALAASRNSMTSPRVYTIEVTTTDASGNSSKATTTVTVQKKNGK